nr:unnamed protein product [Digitaria exilis]
MGTPSVDHVFRRYAGEAHVEDPGAVAAERAAVEAAARELEETKALADAEKNRMDAIGNKVVGAAEAAGKRFWWEVDVEALGEAELSEFARALQRVREVVQREAGKLEVSAPAAAVSGRRRGNRRDK